MNYRHERKYEITYADGQILERRLPFIMQKDIHGVNGRYTVRSLYFDNLYDKALLEKINGVNNREKFRLRYYDNDTSVIRLEKKSKRNGMSCKQSASLEQAAVRRILQGDVAWLQDCENPLLQEFYMKYIQQGIRPKTIVNYTRTAFTYRPGNVRVTIDTNIRTGLYGKDFLNVDCITLPVAEPHRLLEVKWDAYLPEVIWMAIQLGNQGEQAFSKYAACREYDMG